MHRTMIAAIAAASLTFSLPSSRASILTNDWSFAKSNYNGSAFSDLAGSDPATPVNFPSGYNYSTGAGGAYTTGANGTANGAASVTDPSGGAANGFTTALSQFGDGTSGSPWTYQFMFEWQSTAYRFGYQTNRGSNGPISLTDGYSVDSNHVTLSVGATTIWSGTAGPLWNPTAGHWYDFAITYDGSSLDLYITPYSATATAATVSSDLLASFSSASLVADGGDLGIGCCDASKYGNNGAYDWAAVYSAALTPAQIAYSIDNDSAVVPVPEPSALVLLGAALAGALAMGARSRRFSIGRSR